ncbi:MAG: phosphoribosylformylglycinamidine synthase subunit PurS [Deltaproteobacteria bacterium]|nr:phosphoribosylformylglycinamidine synthase subunit PurS [Deltaproteobacteria bacterium]
MIAKVYITLKNGVLDPQGQAVQKSLHLMGFQGLSSVRLGKYIEVCFEDSISKEKAKEELKSMCEKLLANTVIEDYRIELP